MNAIATTPTVNATATAAVKSKLRIATTSRKAAAEMGVREPSK